MKLCKDCRWSSNAGEFARCNHPNNIHPVTGGAKFGCGAYRMFGWFSARLTGNCGIEARFFEPYEG